MTLPTPSQIRERILGDRRRIIPVADTRGVTRKLTTTRFTDLTGGRVGVLARPGMRRIGWLAADTLRALGCSDDVTGAGRPGEGDWTLVAVWLNAHQIRHLYIQHAWTMPLTVLEAVTDLADRTGCTIWLVGDTPYTDRHANVLAARGSSEPITGEEFNAAWADLTPAPARTPNATLQPPDWPARVPDDDFTTFRTTCRDLLSPDQFRLVDHYFRDQVTTAVGEVQAAVTAGEVTEEHVAARLHSEWEATPSLAHYLTFLRANQVAFFHSGYYLQVDLDQLVGTAGTMPRRALRSAETWERLHAYPEPHRATICALAAAGLGVEQIHQVTVNGYQPGTGTVRLPDGTTVDIEPDARIYLTAQWHLRMLTGARDGDPLITGSRGKPLRRARPGHHPQRRPPRARRRRRPRPHRPQAPDR